MKKRRKSSNKQRRTAKARRTDRDKRGEIRAPRDDPPAPRNAGTPARADPSVPPLQSPGHLADCQRRARIVHELLPQFPGDNIEQLARRMGIAAHTLSLDYKAATGNILDDVVRENSLQHAARLLTTGPVELSIKQVATACGYGKQGNFTRAFKRRFRKSPRQYRRTMS